MSAGSDADDLLLAVEQTFGVTIPIKDSVEMRTVADLLRFLQDKLKPRDNTVCLTMQTFFRFRAEIMQTLGVARTLVRPQSKIEDIILPKDRRKFWKQLKNAGFHPPRLTPSNPVGCVGFGAMLCLPLCFCLLFWFPAIILLPVIFLLAIVTYIIFGPLAIYPPPCRTVGDLVLQMTLVQNGPGSCGLTYHEINKKARLLISDQLCLPIEDITDNAQFVKDFNID